MQNQQNKVFIIYNFLNSLTFQQQHKPNILISAIMKRFFLLLLFITLTSISFGQKPDTLMLNGYEYMTIVGAFPQNKIASIYITEPGGKYERVVLDNYRATLYKYGETTAIIELLEKYSKLGWLLHNSNMTSDSGTNYFYYLMTRKKVH